MSNILIRTQLGGVAAATLAIALSVSVPADAAYCKQGFTQGMGTHHQLGVAQAMAYKNWHAKALQYGLQWSLITNAANKSVNCFPTGASQCVVKARPCLHIPQ
jgi:hypothetical protein